jgi:hypothetical protein
MGLESGAGLGKRPAEPGAERFLKEQQVGVEAGKLFQQSPAPEVAVEPRERNGEIPEINADQADDESAHGVMARFFVIG